MSNREPVPKTYLGDSVYAEDHGYIIRLTTENVHPGDPSNEIFLEESVLGALVEYARRMGWIVPS